MVNQSSAERVRPASAGSNGHGVAEAHASRIVAGVSHDLRGPLAVVTGYLETLIRNYSELDGAARDELLRSALRAAHREAHLIERLLDHALLESGSFPMSPHPLHVASEVNRVVDEYVPLESQSRITIRVSDDVWVLADDVAFDRILSNLIGNALQHSPPDMDVLVDAVGVNGRVTLAVGDRGPGIDPAVRHHLFEPFRHGRNGGAGLGLAIARHAVEALGGKIWAESENGSGTRVSFTLERSAAPVPTDRPADAP